MSHAEALRLLGASAAGLSENEKQQLDDRGFVVRAGAIDAAQLAPIVPAVHRLIYEQRVFGMEHPPDPGCETVWGITQKDPGVAELATVPFPWSAADHVFEGDAFVGGNADYRSPMPGSGMQRWRRTEPRPDGGFSHLVVLYVILDWDPVVSGLRVVPGSHRFEHGPGGRGDAPLDDRSDQVVIGAAAGSVVVVNASCWHSSAINASSTKRYVLTAPVVRAGSGAPPHLASTPAPLRRLAPAARSLLNSNPHVDGTIAADGKPCWCCGVERRCHASGVVPPAELGRDEEGVVIPPDDSMAAYGFPAPGHATEAPSSSS